MYTRFVPVTSALASLRFFLHVAQASPHDPSPKRHPGEVARGYFQAAVDAGIPCAGLPIFSGRFSPESPWNRLATHFQRQTADRYVNVVIGQGEAFQRGWTRGVPNVAVLGAWPLVRGAEDRRWILRYDAAICPDEDYRRRLLEIDITLPASCVVPPEPAALIKFFRTFRGYLLGNEPCPPQDIGREIEEEERRRAEAFAEKMVKESSAADAQEAMKKVLSGDAKSPPPFTVATGKAKE